MFIFRRRVAGDEGVGLAAGTVPSAEYISPPQRCVRLTELVVRDGGTWTAWEKGERTEYAEPVHASEEVRAWLRAGAAAEESCEEGVAVLPGGRVFGAGAVLSADGAEIARDVSVDFGKTWDEHWLLGFGRMRAPESVSGATAVLATALGDGYAHWLLEEWPRMLALGARLTECDAVIAHEAGRLGREALRRCGFTGRVIVPRRMAHFAGERLVVPSLVAPAGFPTRALVRLVREGAPADAAAPGWGERIYVSRAQARRRRVANEAALWARLEARGFVNVHAEEWSWAEQVAGFRAAKEIVAPHGAGLANLVWCAPGTRVVECFHRAYVNPCFWRLAAVAELDYRPVVTPGEEAVRCELAANKADIAVEVAAVERALTRG